MLCHLWGHRQPLGMARASHDKSRESSKTPQWPPQALQTIKAIVWAPSWNFTGIYCTLPFLCPQLPTCDKSQPQMQLFRSRTVTASSESEGLEWASCKSRSAAFSLPRDRKAANSRHCFVPWEGQTPLGKGTVPLTAVHVHFESDLTHFSQPWPRSVPHGLQHSGAGPRGTKA